MAVDSVSTLLATRGIDVHPSGACPQSRVEITRDGTDLTVAIVDADGRRSTRTVGDAESAANLVESWVRRDVNAGLLLGRSDEGVETPAPATPGSLAVAVTEAPPRRTANHSLVTIAVAGESSVAFDGSVWVGMHGLGCVRWGAACIGASGRAQIAVDDSTQRGIDVLGAIEIPIQLRRASVVPGVGFGVGWLAAGQMEGENAQSAWEIGLRGDAHVSIAYPLGRWLALHAGVALDVSIGPGNGEQNQSGNNDGGEPRGFVRADVGLRFGVR